jgi:hypothetical protein
VAQSLNLDIFQVGAGMLCRDRILGDILHTDSAPS